MAFTLPQLPYAFDALEPHVDAQTMEIHHGKHHQGYTDKLNAAIEGTDLENKTIEEILMNLDDVAEDIRTAVRNNGGGFANHTLFWNIMSPQGGGDPVGKVRGEIHKTWSSFAAFQEEFKTAATGQFGSGWAWLVADNDGKLHVYSTPNQDSPYSQGHRPILGIDVWEHAYYLHYQNKRADYIDAWWNVVDWNKVEEMYDMAMS